MQPTAASFFNVEPSPTIALSARQASASAIVTGNKQLDQLLDLLSNGFQTTITTTAFFASLASSLGFTLLIIAVFSVLRPLNNVVYAPRAKYADSKHVPPPVPRHPLGWVKPVVQTKEHELIDKLGLDATIFLRFTRMSRMMFTVLSVIGCGIMIPTNIIAGRAIAKGNSSSIKFLLYFTPKYLYASKALWSYVVVAYLFDAVICYFLWHNYRAVVRLRRAYFDSAEYQQSLAARTLLMMEIPKDLRSDDGIGRIAEETQSTTDVPRAAIARNVKELPELVSEHTKTVEQLEEVLAKYLSNPNKLPIKRPTCSMHKKDAGFQRGKKVDAIEYLTNRIQQLERQVKETRQSVDKRNAQNFGFASYQQVADAHSVAYAGRKGGAKKTVIRLAPKPHDLIWQNLPMTGKDRGWANFINNLWVALLTVFWIVPNVLSAVFLTNLSHLGQVWNGFNKSLLAHPVGWGIVQGIAAPAIQSLFYYFLPAIFRRLSISSGDVTKTSRERHVLHKLFAFFVFNNLIIYSIFSALWTYIVVVVVSDDKATTALKSIENGLLAQVIEFTLIDMSNYWLTWLLQRNLGAAIDLAQFVNLAWGSFSRRYLSPTPRELIKLSAPQPFDYAGYYNYFLFYIIVTLFYAPLQPLALPVTTLYFWVDSHMKKYLLMYVFITKTESGGKFWRVLFNRVLISAFFGNLVIALTVGVQGSTWGMCIALAPLPFLLIAFKIYCARAFDNKIDYYATSTNVERDGNSQETKSKAVDKVGVRFGHPVLYKPLITPMVHAKAQHLLRDIYTGRTDLDDDTNTVAGYSDVYMDPMSHSRPGKLAGASNSPFEIVSESDLSFDNFKDRADFRGEAGGDGELYGRSSDMVRRGSEQSTMTDMLYGGSRPGTSQGNHPRSGSRSESVDSERTYPAGYHAPSGRVRDQSVDTYSNRSEDLGKQPMRGRGPYNDESRTDLLGDAGRMGRSPTPQRGGQGRNGSQGPSVRGWTMGDGITPGATQTPDETTSYDYFRGRR